MKAVHSNQWIFSVPGWTCTDTDGYFCLSQDFGAIQKPLCKITGSLVKLSTNISAKKCFTYAPLCSNFSYVENIMLFGYQSFKPSQSHCAEKKKYLKRKLRVTSAVTLPIGISVISMTTNAPTDMPQLGKIHYYIQVYTLVRFFCTFYVLD